MVYRILVSCFTVLLLHGCGGSNQQVENDPFIVVDSGPFIGDDDRDGLNNQEDLCPNSQAGVAVDGNGCSESQRDDDADGIANGVDECAATPADAEVDAVGCAASQRDTDGDSITDDIDACPNTMADVEVDDLGCSDAQRDDDNDGVVNAGDVCAATPSGETVNSDGCALSQTDSDDDGVNDSIDQCAATAAGAAVDADGCSDAQNDVDADGVANESDQCPNTRAGQVVDEQGCSAAQLDSLDAPVMRTSGRNILDSTGEQFKMRGVNLQYGDNPGLRLQGIAPIAEVNANIIRLQLRENTTAEQLRDALDAIVARDMVAMVMLWEEEGEITCTEDDTYLLEYVQNKWLGEWLDVLLTPEYQPYLMINIANEWGPLNVFMQETTAYDDYIATYQSIIGDFRDAGFKVPLVIDAAHCGQDWNVFMSGRGNLLAESDPESNVVLSVHAYNFLWNTGEEVDSGIEGLNSSGLPYIFGEFGDSRFQGVQAVDHLALMAKAQAQDLGWIAWSWKGNGSGQTVLDMSTEEGSVALTEHGEDIVNGSFGIASTSVLANFVAVGTPPVFFATGAEATPTGDITIEGSSAQLGDAGGDPTPALTWSFDVPEDGDYQLAIAYTSDNPDRQQNVSFDGGEADVWTFPPGESPARQIQALAAGEHTLEISANWGYMTIHSVELVRINNTVFEATAAIAATSGDVVVVGDDAQLQAFDAENPPTVSWTFDVPEDGDYRVSLGYTSDNDERQQNIVLDGESLETRTFLISGSPSQSTHSLTAGEHVFEVVANWGYMTLHHIEVVRAPAEDQQAAQKQY